MIASAFGVCYTGLVKNKPSVANARIPYSVTGGFPLVSQKILVLDTSAVISLVQNIATIVTFEEPGFAGVLGDAEIVIPRVVLDELDRLKREHLGKVAIEAAKQLENYSLKGNLLDGVETEKGGTLRIAPRPSRNKITAWGLKTDMADHEILASALEIDDTLRSSFSSVTDEGANNEKKNLILITQDRILRVLARSVYNINAEELKSVWAQRLDRIPGYLRHELSSKEFDEILETGKWESKEKLWVNEFIHIVDIDNPNMRYAYGMVAEDGFNVEIIDKDNVNYLKVAGDVMGKNTRQKLLLWALMGCGESNPHAENGIRLITVSGPAGSGKSFLTLAAAWERLERGHFERIILTRPMVEVGTSVGFLPGSLEEKLKPWGGLIEDNLRAIVQVPEDPASKRQNRGVSRNIRPFDAKAWLEMENRLELIPLTYIRGRTFRNSLVILEEAQNIERGPLKVLLTRLGEGSVVVIIGDMSQIDNQFLSERNNGLAHVIDAFRNWPGAIHINLENIVRSDLAEAANRLM